MIADEAEEAKAAMENAEVSHVAEDTGTCSETVGNEPTGPDAPETDAPEADAFPGELETMLDKALSGALQPLEQAVKVSASFAERAEAASAKVLDLYTLMTENRNRATLLLTKHVEMFERIKGLADLCGQTIVDDGDLAPGLKSILVRTRNMAKVAERTLASFGAVPVWPERGDAFDETMHRIVAETPPAGDGDVPGAIAECLTMGLVRDGIVAKAAEVVVFKAKTAPQTTTTDPQP